MFDTGRMTDGIPQSGNLLTNYTLDLSDVVEECLWPRSYYYEAADAYKGELGPIGLPVARRRDDQSFLIADEKDLKALNRLTVDGETVLIKITHELVDASSLSWVYDVAEEYVPRAATAFEFLMQASYGKDGDLAATSANAAGFSLSLAPFFQKRSYDKAP